MLYLFRFIPYQTFKIPIKASLNYLLTQSVLFDQRRQISFQANYWLQELKSDLLVFNLQLKKQICSNFKENFNSQNCRLNLSSYVLQRNRCCHQKTFYCIMNIKHFLTIFDFLFLLNQVTSLQLINLRPYLYLELIPFLRFYFSPYLCQ